jgi:hypothetical protein
MQDRVTYRKNENKTAMPTAAVMVATNASNSVTKTKVGRLSEWYFTRTLNKAIPTKEARGVPGKNPIDWWDYLDFMLSLGFVPSDRVGGLSHRQKHKG